MAKYRVVDVETTTFTSFKRKANPFDDRNFVVTVGHKDDLMQRAAEIRFGGNKQKSDGTPWLKEMLKDTKMLVVFNGKFDVLHGLKNPESYAAWMEWIAAGGIVWDCQTAEYLLQGMTMQSQYLSLDEVAPEYGGHVKESEVKALWEAGVQTHDIHPDILRRYLIGDPREGDDSIGDVGNTELVFLGQLRKARACGQLKSILLNMGAYAYIIEAERNGLYVDKAAGLELAKAREVELAEVSARLAAELPKDLPFEFNWGSSKQLSALIFGGDIKYVAKEYVLDEEGNHTYYQKDAVAYFIGGEEVVPDASTEAELDDWLNKNSAKLDRIASGKNQGSAKTKKVKVPDIERGPKERNADFYYHMDGYTKGRKCWESEANPGVFSVSGEVIEILGETTDIPFLKDLALQSLVAKDLSTYYLTTDPKTGEQKGMLTLVMDDNLVHGQLNTNATVTGRLSSSGPNLQNISGKAKSQVKSIFMSRFGKGGKIIQSDFTSLEVYVQALLTGDKAMLADLEKGLDMHILRLCQKLHREYDELYALYKAGDKEITAARKGAKSFSFERAFGAGAESIAAKNKMSVEEVEALIADEEARYPGIKEYYSGVTKAVNKSCVKLPGKFMPHPDYPAKTIQLGRGYFRTPDGKLYAYDELPAQKYMVERGIWTTFMPTEIKNYVVQGTGAEVCKAAMWLAVRAFYGCQNFGGRALLVSQVHDACYCDAAPERAAAAAAMLDAAMRCASPFVQQWFGWTIKVPVPTETKWGDSMIEEEDIPGLSDLSARCRRLIEQRYFTLS